LFPIELRAWGVDRTETNPVEIEMNLFLNQTKDNGYVLNGDEGLAPSCGGVGTLYYSVTNLKLTPTLSWLKVNGKKYSLTKGKLWYDHQWATGFMPAGNVRSDVMRAGKNTQEKKLDGWDWMEIQFDDDTEINLSALHSVANSRFYEQTGDTPPGTMVADAYGVYVDKAGATIQVTGKMTVSKWIKSTKSHGQYQASQTWYPNRADIILDAKINLPVEKRTFSMIPIVETGQQGFFAAGYEYSEGAVYIEQNGIRTGRGFLEAPGYDLGIKQNLRLAGLPDTAEMLRILNTSQQPSADLIKQSQQFLAIKENADRLIQEGQACRGVH
jgi:Lipocalin-like domain/CrtC N-terminal lipocalin domain